MTRKSGFNASAAVRLRREQVETVHLEPGQVLTAQLVILDVKPGLRIGFGGWFSGAGLDVTVAVPAEVDLVVSDGEPPVWRKFGSQWVADGSGDFDAEVEFLATEATDVALYGLDAGHVFHEAFDATRPELLTNNWSIAPEGNFYVPATGVVEVFPPEPWKYGALIDLALKSCNRCGRFLPVNVPPNERFTLSYSNHCIARAPCKHASFGRIQDDEDPDVVHYMHYGFQLECRFCKKFFVNAALNPQRTAGQMKEDAARRRAFEVLLEQLNQGSQQLAYKNRTGRDLAADVHDRFGGACFKCGQPFGADREMHLDHTRPLALLWPLDAHATALCSDHNSEKRDRPPAEYYTDDELIELAEITGLAVEELRDPSPNVEAIEMLRANLDWFFDEFIPSGELDKVREGKATAALLCKALQKAIDRTPGGAPYDIAKEARRRGIE
jgi:hypothetical protein